MTTQKPAFPSYHKVSGKSRLFRSREELDAAREAESTGLPESPLPRGRSPVTPKRY